MSDLNKCNKVVVEKGGFNAGKWNCQRPVVKDGLCSYHYKRRQSKLTPYGERKEYRPATQEDADNGKSLKLKASNRNHTHRMVNGELRINTGKEIIISQEPVDYNLFCVKK